MAATTQRISELTKTPQRLGLAEPKKGGGEDSVEAGKEEDAVIAEGTSAGVRLTTELAGLKD